MMELFYYGCEFIHTAAIAWVIWNLIAEVGRVKINPVWEIVIQIAVVVFTAAMQVYNCQWVLVSNNFIIMSVLILSGVAKIAYTNRFGDNLLIGGNFWMVLCLGDFLVQTVVYLIWFQGAETDFLMEVSVGRGLYLLARTVVIIIMGRGLVHQIKRLVTPLFKRRLWLWGATVAMFFCLVYFQRIYLYKNFEIQEILLNHWWIFGLVLALIAVMFAAYRVKENEQRKSQLAQMKFELLENSYQQVMKERANKNILVHDMKNHLISILRLVEQGEDEKAEHYIREMYEVLESKKNCAITNHLLLDLILDNKITTAEEKWIHINVESDDLSGMRLSDVETCSLFANLIDNALEANERLNAAEGWVEMTCSRKDKLLVINMVNPTDKIITSDMGLPETTKENKKLHGFGMRSIQQIAENYGGYMNYHVEDGKFYITVCISVFE